jgi:spermidine synthase
VNSKKIHLNVLIFLFFVSGACGLIYEVLWLRNFTSTFGVTVYATSIVLAAFMGGLALGSYLLGRFAELRGSPLRIYSFLEIGIGLYALFIPLIFSRLNSLYSLFYLHWSDDLTLTLAVRLAFSFMVLLFPTTMRGATLPVMSKFFATHQSMVGKESGRLYAFNTLGAVTGAVCTGFILIPLIGVSKTNYLAASLNISVGLIVLLFGSAFEAPAFEAPIRRRRSVPRRRRSVENSPPNVQMNSKEARWILLLIGISGFAALSYEIIWTKVMSIITFNTVFAFTSMLAAFLLGIALGSYVFVKSLDARKDLWTMFLAIQLGIGAYAFVSPQLFGSLAGHYYKYQTEIVTTGVSWGFFVFKQFLLSALIMMVPTLLMGATFPLACKIYSLGTGKKAAGVGNVYASNTLGAIAGSALTGLIFIPVSGLKGGLLVAGSLSLSAAVISLFLNSNNRRGRARSLLVLASVIALLYIVVINTDLVFMKQVRKMVGEVIFHREDATGVVEVVSRDGQRYMITNRLHTEGSSVPSAIYYQKKQGYFPLLLHPDPESFIEIGLGTGIGFSAVSYEKVKEPEIVEISKGVVEAAAFFNGENDNVLHKPKVKLIMDDGRNYMFLTRRKYDLIVMGLFTPYRWGVGYLYTRETYLNAREKLKDGGIVVQWLALSQFTPDNLKMVVNTFSSVFPYIYLWDKGYYLALMGMNEELEVDFERFKAAFRAPSIKADLEKWGLDDPYNYLASFLMGSEEAKKFALGASLNTEDRPRIEFSSLEVHKAAFSFEYAAQNSSH